MTRDDRKNIDAHQCSIDVIELYSNRIAVYLDASKERLLKEYQKHYELEEMPCVRVTSFLAASTLVAPPPAQPAPSKNYGERTRSLLNERANASASTNVTNMAVVGRLAETEPPPQPDTFVDASLYIKLKATFEVIFFSGWGECMQQYHFNEIDDRMTKLEKGQTVTKYAEETAMELDGKILMDAKLIGKYITHRVAAAMAKKTKQYEKKNKTV